MPDQLETLLPGIESGDFKVYVILFYDSTNDLTEELRTEFKAICHIWMEGDETIFGEIDVSDPQYADLVDVTGVTKYPSAFLSVHGWGVWIETDNADSFNEAFNEWFYRMKEANETEETPY